MQAEFAASIPGRRLGEAWNFMSDHLPLGLTLAWGDDPVALVSWNILNSAYLRWIYKDEQGLMGSFITQHDVRDGDSDFSRRDEAVVDAVLDLALGAHPRAVVGLQECSVKVRQAIIAGLAKDGADFGILAGSDKSEVVTFYNKRLLRVDTDLPEIRYHNGRGKTILPALFTVVASGKRFLFFNTHCPFDNASCVEMATNATRLAQEHRVPVVVVGDMNATSKQVTAAFAKAAQDVGTRDLFSWVPGYRTHISASLKFCDYDNAHFAPGDSDASVTCDEPAAVLRGLPALVGKLV
eukprot:TRINITY_DN31313_c0_g1_i1.p1 TRINITY_DN31313_c0_g1~~TRINITY_DN31313_c0_g1_i1.p1  ORF type:complete len:295 (-),score=49.47 TRINITY_DN31313_c0_g1_i1:91-975(-)